MTDTHVSVRENSPRIQYPADGINTVFETPFAIFKANAVRIFLNEEEISSSMYDIMLDKERRARITFNTPPKAKTIITILRDLQIERTSHFQDGGSLRSNVLNYEFDYQMACLQQMADNLNRSMIMPPYALDPKIKLTLPSPKAGKSIMWSEDGQTLVNSEVEINKISKELDDKVVVATTAADTATEQAEIATQKAEIAVIASEGIVNKVNKDMDNVTAIGKNEIIHLIMPDYSAGISYVGTTVGLDITFPTDGYFYINGASTDGVQTCLLKYNNIILGGYVGFAAYNNGQRVDRILVEKGTNYNLIQTSTALFSCMFYPLKGAI